MLSSTLKDYQENYINRLSNYLESYIDRSELSFLEIEIHSYNDYQAILNKLEISNRKEKSIKKKLLCKLKKINITAYNSIVSEEINCEETSDKKRAPILLNIEELINLIISSREILNFILLEQRLYTHSNNVYKPIDLIGKQPYAKRKKQTVIPENQKEFKVSPEDNPSKTEDSKGNSSDNYIKSSISEYLEDIEEYIDEENFKILKEALFIYITTDKFPKLEHKIMFKYVNKKKVGWALKQVYKNLKSKKLDIEYFKFAKENINLFSDAVIVTEDFSKSKFYKYFTTNPNN